MSDQNASDNLKERLQRALKHKAVLAERSKLLQQQVEDFRNREASMNRIASELLQRQRELNYMLHRASSVLHQMQDTNLALSAEFTHLVKELPAPKDGDTSGKAGDWEETIARVNDLFRRTHELAGEMQDEIFRSTSESPLPEADITPSPITVTTGPIPEPKIEAPAVEVPAVETSEPEQSEPAVKDAVIEAHVDEPIVEAELMEKAPEVKDAPAPEPEIVEVKIVESPADTEPIDDDEQDESVDELFRRLNAVTADTDEWRDDGRAAEPARKPSLLARIFGMADEE